jgi:hypothetical protein
MVVKSGIKSLQIHLCGKKWHFKAATGSKQGEDLAFMERRAKG